MTKDEALRIALRAMVVNNYAWKYLAESGDAGNFEAKEQGHYQLNEKAIIAVEAALEEKVEPIAWLVWEHKKFPSLTFTKPADKYLFFSLYTTPPQRTWVGLTDKDISEIVRGTHNTGSFVRAIEAKLKELNT